MSTIYCGNNARSNDILNGNKVVGTRYGCMRKGIGKGLNSHVDNTYLGDYEPIDKRKIYCGNDDNLPDGYDLMGNLPQCLQKGIGIGKKQKAKQSINENSKNNKGIIYVIVYIILCIGIFLVLYFTKPNFISNKEKDKNVINIKKLLIYYTTIIGFLGIILFILSKMI